MRKFFPFLLFPLSALVAQMCSGNVSPKSPCAGWEALSQLDSLMPGRIWEQEFHLIVDKKAFQKQIPDWVSLHKQGKRLKSLCVLGQTNRYFLKSTMSGPESRLIDRYEEFQWSPFWRYPPTEETLRAMEKQVRKDPR